MESTPASGPAAEERSLAKAESSVRPLEEVFSPVAGELDLVTREVEALRSTGSPLLDEATGLVTRTRGKLIRPGLLLLSSLAGDGRDPKSLVRAATAFELLHLSSLTHDDIMDSSPVRRGAASVWRRCGTSVALLTGDFLYGKALRAAAESGLRTCRSLARVILRLVEGQALEIESRGRATPQGYVRSATAKTAFFCAEACHLGASLGGAGPALAGALRRFGLAVGQAYQMTDDLLDWEGDPDQTGKSVLTDIAHGVQNLPLLVGLARNPERVKKLVSLFALAGDPDESRRAATLLRRELEQNGALVETARRAEARTAAALTHLGSLSPGVPRDNLAALAACLARRRS